MSEKQIIISGVSMPEWLSSFEVEAGQQVYRDDEAKLRVAFALAQKNVEFATGGPFGAAIFDADGRVIALGVNRVVPSGQFWTHAEMTALSLAQQKTGRLHLENCTLASSCEPCAMCMGGIPWSGISTLIYGAPGSEAEKIGFDEGEKPENWRNAYEKRGINVRGPLFADVAAMTLQLYGKKEGKIY